MNATHSERRIALATLVCILGGAVALATLDLAVGVPAAVTASSGGKVGFSGNPAQGGQTCNRCHSGGTAPEVRITGPAHVMPGEMRAYTLTIAGGQRVAGGLGVSADGGFLLGLLGNMDVQEVDGEITHVRPKRVDDAGVVEFHFAWSAPETTGRFTLYGAGNSTDGASGPRGDAAVTTTLVIAVGDVPPPTETATPGATPTPGESATPGETPTPATPVPTESPVTPVPTESPTTPAPTTPTTTPGPTATPAAGPIFLPCTLRTAVLGRTS